MRQEPKWQAVIFDMDGVIIDSEPLWTEAERQLLARRNLEYSPQLKVLLMGRDSREAVSLMVETYNLRERMEEVIRERNELVAHLFKRWLKPVPYVLELITSLRDWNIRTALASSSPESLIHLVLDKFNITGHFDLVLSGDQVARGKPAPDIYLTAATLLRVDPKDCLVVEDAPNGVAAAKAAGMCCLAISASASAAKLAEADWVVGSFYGLRSVEELNQMR